MTDFEYSRWIDDMKEIKSNLFKKCREVDDFPDACLDCPMYCACAVLCDYTGEFYASIDEAIRKIEDD